MKKIIFLLGMIGLLVGQLYAGPVSLANIKYTGNVSEDLAKIHRGQIYETSHIFASVAVDGFAKFMVDMSSPVVTINQLHAKIQINCPAEVIVSIYKNPVFLSSGTPLVPVNLNDTVDDSPETLFYYSPVVDSSGTLKTTYSVIPGNGGQGQSDRAAENVWADITYLVTIQNKSSDTVHNINGLFDFYETE